MINSPIAANFEGNTKYESLPPRDCQGYDGDLGKNGRKLQHLGDNRQYWRDMILGVNDGIISTFLLVAGVAGGGLTSRDILLTSVSGALAGAVSMCAGEYIATKSQNEVIHGELALEKFHVERYRDEELDELGELLDLIGISKDQRTLRKLIHEHYGRNPESLLQIMSALEFGVIDKEERSPIRAGLFSCALFAIGSLPSVLPFACCGENPTMGLIVATGLTIVALMIVGAVKTWATRTNWVSAALENLIIAGFGGGLAYLVGILFDQLVKV
jgi:VIT1/CCC1 family predicted Fe2+/Mn2+ transporter